MKNGRIVYIDALRILAILGVIIIHVSAVGVSDWEIGSKPWVISKIYGSMFRWSVPIFFMVSGAMFLGTDKKYSFQTMIRKYISRLLVCIFMWGFFYSLFDQYIYGSLSAKSLFIALWGIFSNHTGYHLWYLYFIIMLYLMVPVFQIVVTNMSKQHLRLLLILWFIFSLGINQINELILGLDIGVSVIDFSLPVISEYTGYFLLGFYLYEFEFDRKIENILVFVGLVCMVAGTALNVCASVRLNCAVDSFTSTCGMTNCLSCVAVWLLIKRIKIWQSEKAGKIITKIAQNVFGIYLVHVFFNSLLFRIFKLPLSSNVFGIALYAILIMMCSYLTTALLRKIPVIQRFV